MNEITVSIRLENIRPEGVIHVNGDEYENGAYIHYRTLENEQIHVSLTYFGHVFYNQLYEAREDSIILFRAPDTTIITCSPDLGDEYLLNGTTIVLPYPVTAFDGAHFELTRRRIGESDITVSVKPTLGTCNVITLFDGGYLGNASQQVALPTENPINGTVIDGTKQGADVYDKHDIETTYDASALRETDQQRLPSDTNAGPSTVQNVDGAQQRLAPDIRTISFKNVPADFSVYIGGNKLVNNEYKFNARTGSVIRWYEIWYETKIIGRFPLSVAGEPITLVTVPDFVWVPKLEQQDVSLLVNGSRVEPPCWIPVSDNKSVHVQLLSGKNEVLFAQNVQVSGSKLHLTDLQIPTNLQKTNMPFTGVRDRSYPILVSTFTEVRNSTVGRIVLSLIALFVIMLYIKYAKGAPRWLPLVLLVLINTLIWSKSTSETPT